MARQADKKLIEDFFNNYKKWLPERGLKLEVKPYGLSIDYRRKQKKPCDYDDGFIEDIVVAGFAVKDFCRYLREKGLLK